jgi:uncharacterized membrane protein YGL010W
MSSNS